MDVLGVEQHAVLLLAVVAQTLAVIGEQDDERAIVDAEGAELVDQFTDDAVRGRNLAVVGQRVARAIGLRRLIGGVRLVQVKEQEEWLAGGGAEPRLHGVERLLPGPLQAAEPGAGAKLDGVLVEIERRREPGLALEHEGGDPGACRIAGVLQHLRQEGQLVPGDLRGVEPVADVVAHAVRRGQQAGQDRAVGRQGQRCVRVRLGVEHAVAAQGVDRRRVDSLVAEDGQMVGAQGVDQRWHDGVPAAAASRWWANEAGREERDETGGGEAAKHRDSESLACRNERAPRRAPRNIDERLVRSQRKWIATPQRKTLGLSRSTTSYEVAKSSTLDGACGLRCRTG